MALHKSAISERLPPYQWASSGIRYAAMACALACMQANALLMGAVRAIVVTSTTI
ncbi:MAG: hypothetical protein AB8B87_09720 [Granulosicoccus sp.]